jgi:hypothetical protein
MSVYLSFVLSASPVALSYAQLGSVLSGVRKSSLQDPISKKENNEEKQLTQDMNAKYMPKNIFAMKITSIELSLPYKEIFTILKENIYSPMENEQKKK